MYVLYNDIQNVFNPIDMFMKVVKKKCTAKALDNGL